MGKTIKLALNYIYDEGWIGGTYYIENLIHALNALPIKEKPELIIIATNDSYQKLKDRVPYPYLKQFIASDDRSILMKTLHKIWRKLFRSDLFEKRVSVKGLFPFPSAISFLESEKQIHWIPDFQVHYLPSFFSDEEVIQRKKSENHIAQTNDCLVLSSKDAFNSFQELYPNASVKTYVIPFTVKLPDISHIDYIAIKKELDIVEDYFICPNQFWKHKDHQTLFYAIDFLKKQGVEVVVYLTGKAEDHRFPDHFNNLMALIREMNLETNIIYLGFLERSIQLSLMKNAKAVIQPSLFEGWSTVVEDSKSLGSYIIASDIDVHKEQLLSYKCSIFERGNPESLAQEILRRKGIAPTTISSMDYESNILKFGEKFLKMLKDAN